MVLLEWFFFSEAMGMCYHEDFSFFPSQIIVFCRRNTRVFWIGPSVSGMGLGIFPNEFGVPFEDGQTWNSQASDIFTVFATACSKSYGRVDGGCEIFAPDSSDI